MRGLKRNLLVFFWCLVLFAGLWLIHDPYQTITGDTFRKVLMGAGIIYLSFTAIEKALQAFMMANARKQVSLKKGQ